MPLILKIAPDRLGLAEIAENIDTSDAARFRPRRRCFRRPAFDRGRHGHLRACQKGIFTFSARGDLCKEMSTKGNDNAATAKQIRRTERRYACRPISDSSPAPGSSSLISAVMRGLC